MIAAVVAAAATSLAALIGSGAILILGRRAEHISVWIFSFAIGTLGGAALLHLVPEALERRPLEDVMLLVLAGVVLFIVMERTIRWRHTHVHDTDASVTARVLLWGDALHNFIDGIVLGVAFQAGTETGLVTAMAVFAHEVPQEIGDFAVLLGTGMKRGRAMAWNYASAATVIPGAIVASLWSASLEASIGWLLPIAAGGFLYIALADLVPALHHSRGAWAAVVQIALIVLGVAVIWINRGV
jgi:zinc and cadmium transporter